MGLVLEGILNAPYPDDPAEMSVVEWAQARAAMSEAGAEISRLRAIEARARSAHSVMHNEAKAAADIARRLRDRNTELHAALDPPARLSTDSKKER